MLQLQSYTHTTVIKWCFSSITKYRKMTEYDKPLCSANNLKGSIPIKNVEKHCHNDNNGTHSRRVARTESAELPQQVEETCEVRIFAEEGHRQLGSRWWRQVRSRDAAVRSAENSTGIRRHEHHLKIQ